jgi:phosphonate transport system ATP-binding protein
VTATIAVRVSNVSKVYPNGVKALDKVSLEVAEGEFLAVLGLSGSGKSTLLRSINRLVDPSEGTIELFGRDVTKAEGKTLRSLRGEAAMIFQQFNVKRHSVLTNVLTGALGRVGGLRSLLMSFPAEEVAYARACLARVGLDDRASSRADALSGGQQQRVAIARALMQKPRVVLADEPVASLDPALRHSVMRHIEALNRDEGLTVLCSLHDLDLVTRYATRVVALREGKVVHEGSPSAFTKALLHDIYGGTPTSITKRFWREHRAAHRAGTALLVDAPVCRCSSCCSSSGSASSCRGRHATRRVTCSSSSPTRCSGVAVLLAAWQAWDRSPGGLRAAGHSAPASPGRDVHGFFRSSSWLRFSRAGSSPRSISTSSSPTSTRPRASCAGCCTPRAPCSSKA